MYLRVYRVFYDDETKQFPPRKTQLGASVPENLSAEIDVFENEIALRKQGKIEDRIFAETRLRRGAYG